MHWFKAHNEALTDPKLKWVARQLEVELPTAIGWWMCLLSMASASPQRGKLMLTDTEPYTVEDIACNVTCNVSVTIGVLQVFQKAGLLAQKQGVFNVPNWDKRQGNAKPGAQRTRECRERKRLEDVTLQQRYCNGIELELDIDSTPISPKGESVDANFTAWYKAYPKKKKPLDAQKAWGQTKGKRPPLSDMLAALEWQRTSFEWTKNGGQFIPWPASYLRAGSWAEEPSTELGGNGHDKEKDYLFQGLTCVETKTHKVWIESKDVDYFRNGNSQQQTTEIERIRKSDPGRVQAK